MDEIIHFFNNLFDVSQWPPRWYCGKWTDFHGWLYIVSDITIWLAYLIIPMILVWFIQKGPKKPFNAVFILFGAFIILCGFTHLIDAIIFWWPAYRFSAVVRFVTAVVSLFTVFGLIKFLPKMVSFEWDRQKTDDALAKAEHEVKMKANKILELEEQLNNNRNNDQD